MLMCYSIDDDFIAVDINGNFGHTSLPFAFGSAIAPLIKLTRANIHGVADKYVDDFMIFSHDRHCEIDQNINQANIKALFGDDAIEPSKCVRPSKTANVIGWFVDLTRNLIRPNDKGLNKLLFVFFFVDEKKPQPLKVFQLMASLAERYSHAIKGMRSFVDPLVNATRSWETKHAFAKRQANSSTRFAIEMWRVVAILLWIDKDALSVPLESLALNPNPVHDIIIMTDGSPIRVAASIIDSNFMPFEHTYLPVCFSDPQGLYQNAREYQGGLLGLILILLIKKPTTTCRVLWVCDNTAALTWAEENNCKSPAAQYANIAFTWLQIHTPIQVVRTQHRAGELMGDIDSLSRDYHTLTLNPSLFVDMSSNHTVVELFKLFDPTIPKNLVDHHNAFITIHNLLQSLSSF